MRKRDVINNIVRQRKRHKISVEAVAKHLGVKPQTVWRWERHASTPNLHTLHAWEQYIQVSVDADLAAENARAEAMREGIQNAPKHYEDD